MFKRDRIFYISCGITCVGILLAVLGYELCLLLFVGAYLLRPALHEFGLAKQYADEREHEIHSRSGNLAFVVVILAMVGMVFWRIADGEPTGELYTLIGIGLAARALMGLIMVGDYRKAGVVIIGAVGVFLSLSIVLMGGFSVASAFGVVLGLMIVGFGQLGRKFPITIAIVMALIAIADIYLFDLLQFRRLNMEMWLLFVMPVMTSSLCLFLGGKNEEEVVSTRVRSIVFGSLGVGAAVVFALLLTIGSREELEKVRTVQVQEGEVIEVQGVPCTGGIEYYESGNLMHCSLARDDTLSGQPLAAGTGVHFTEEGIFEWCFLRENTMIQGYLCRGEGHGFMTSFHPNGQLKTIWLGEDKVIQGIPCAKFQFLSAVIGWVSGDKDGATRFYEDGHLEYCELSQNATIDGRNFRRGDAVWFGQDGKPMFDR